MNIKTFVGSIIIATAVFYYILQYKNNPDEYKRKIGILQTASHPALDACRKEFIEALDNTSDTPFEYIIKNGEGSLMNLHAAAQELQLNKDIELFYVIATPALQTLAPLEKERPIVFAAVTDPRTLLDADQTNVTGISDAVDTSVITQNVLDLFPAITSVGLVYNPSEINSTLLVKEFESELKKHNKTIMHIPVASETDVSQAITNALSRVDLLLAPTDNLVANTAPLIAQIAQENHKPFVVSDLKLISTGPALAVGISYDICGEEAGVLASAILQDTIIVKNTPYKKTAMQKGLINSAVFEQLKLDIQESLSKTYNFYPSRDTLVQ